MADLVSIIMPFKNAEAHLRSCLDSICSQSMENWQLCAVDDHSTDGSFDLVKSYSELHPNIHLIRSKGHGIIDALQTGYQMASGNYITRMDADDIMPEQKLEKLLSLLLESPAGTITTGKVKYFSDGLLNQGYIRYEHWLNDLVNNDSHWREIYKECVIPSPCWLISKDDFEKCGGFNSDRYPEDYDLCFRFYQQGMNVKASQDILHLWRDHASRASRNDPNYEDNRFLELKLSYFHELETKDGGPLIVWGAGKKGKTAARWLQDKQLPFEWWTDNAKKLSAPIYGKELQRPELGALSKHAKVMLFVANPDEQATILSRLKKAELALGKQVFIFC